MMILLENIMPKANPYWELLGLQDPEENNRPYPEFLQKPDFIKQYLSDLMELSTTPADMNHEYILEFKKKINMVRFPGLKDSDLVVGMAALDLNALARNKTNVPGVSIFSATARQLIKNVEAALLQMEGVEKPKPTPRRKRKDPELPTLPNPGTLDEEEEEEEEEPEPIPEQPPTPPESELEDLPEDIFMSSLCGICFLPANDPLCSCN